MSYRNTALGTEGSLAAGVTKAFGNIDCRKVRTVSISCRLTYGTSNITAVKVNLYYSSDGNHYDTVKYATFNVDLTAGETVQETHIFDFPEHGYMDIKVENADSSYAVTNVLVFSSVIQWEE